MVFLKNGDVFFNGAMGLKVSFTFAAFRPQPWPRSGWARGREASNNSTAGQAPMFSSNKSEFDEIGLSVCRKYGNPFDVTTILDATWDDMGCWQLSPAMEPDKTPREHRYTHIR